MRKEKWVVYILRCQDESLYVGATNDLEKRFRAHLAGKGSKYVRSRKAAKIAYSEMKKNKKEALKREREIKGFSRQKKLELIELNPVSIPR